MDDIIILAPSAELVHEALTSDFHGLDKAGFNISTRKSQLIPTQRMWYCMLLLNTVSNTFDVGHTHLWYIHKLLFSIYCLRPQVLGYMFYWL
jgi:hypothetical protein